MKTVSVFCGSSLGSDPEFAHAAKSLGCLLAEEKITLVYGGAHVGIMGIVADAVLESGGKAIGVLPRFLAKKELAHKNLTELILCETLHERKAKMFELSQGFIALPGGFGTLDEVCEILTWQQLGLHRFPIIFLNVNHYYDHLALLFQEMTAKQLLKKASHQSALFVDSVQKILPAMKNYIAPEITKWIYPSNI